MYDLINAYVGDVLKSIPPVDIRDYASLVQNLTQTQVAAPTFQKKYTTYWGMRFPCPAWLAVYFQSLQNAVLNPPTLSPLFSISTIPPTTAKGRTVECSFATKLLHMVKPRTPVYDSNVAAFYFFQAPNSGPQKKIAAYVDFHNFLVQEYGRVLQNGLLAASLQAFRQKFPLALQFTDEKVIDFLILYYVRLLENGAQAKGQILYH